MTRRSRVASFYWRGLLVLAAVWGCGQEENKCESADAKFVAFVAAHRSCQEEVDCTLVGDCGPNADFRAVTLGAEIEGMRLMTARCSGPYDGTIPSAVCNAGVCTTDYLHPWGCCGCPLDASNPDSGNANTGF